MTLSVTAAGLTGLGFIGVMAYLVSLTPRPVDEQSTPLVKLGGEGAARAYAAARARPDRLKGRFARNSTVGATERIAPKDEVVSVSAEDISSKLERDLPRLYIPGAPVVHREMLPVEASPAPASYASAETPFVTEDSAPIAELDENRPRMLAALRSEEPEQYVEPRD